MDDVVLNVGDVILQVDDFNLYVSDVILQVDDIVFYAGDVLFYVENVVSEYGVLTVQDDEQLACGFRFEVEWSGIVFDFRGRSFRQL